MVSWCEGGFAGAFCGVVILRYFHGVFLGLCSGGVVVLWFRWCNFAKVFLSCDKLLWLGGIVREVLGKVLYTSVGQSRCREVMIV